jgi:RHH-type transcriptional regulator, proline utilization regulon repressor / proline dehydrogenase / delta 1-pyrroline-5-carboxylate dehydrogenase
VVTYARDVHTHGELLAHDIGRALFAGVRQRKPIPGTRAWLDDLGMAWTMRDEQLKVQLFRFVDALPGLRTPTAIAEHLAEYLGPVADRLPFPARWALGRLRDSAPLTRLASFAATLGVRQLAHKFIAGEDLPRIIAEVTRLRGRHLAFTVDLLGEAVISSLEADDYRDAYLHLIDGLADAAKQWPHDHQIDQDHLGTLPAVNISLKVSALVNRFDPTDPAGSIRAVRTRLEPILRAARRRGVFVNIDMEHNAVRPLTLDLITEVLGGDEFRGWRNVGVAIQAYLRCAGQDLERLLRWSERRGTPFWIRLVKGAYHDHERVVAAQQGWPVPVFTDKVATDANYEALSDWLLDRHEVLRPAFASHNIRSIAHVLAEVEQRCLPQHAIEFQMLYGMAEPLKATLVERGERVRVYAPYGRLLPGMAYLVRRLLENTSNQSFVRVGFLEHGDEEGLLMRPQPAVTVSATVRSKAFTNQPLLDFSRPDNREACARALADLRLRLPLACPAVIGASTIAADDRVCSRNPSRHAQLVAKVATTGEAEARAVVAAAAAAFPGWRHRPVAERAILLERLADELRRRRFDLIALIVLESGKSSPEADADVCEAIDFCRYYGVEMRRLDAGQTRDLPGEHNHVFYEPRGVAVVIAPWNFPLAILCGMATAALVAGNTVIMKPAEQTPGIAAQLMESMQAVGFPPGVANLLPGIGEIIGPVLVGHPDVSLITFTGSVAVGLAINEQAARSRTNEVKRVVCEMGGKNAIIVDADADLDEAVLGVMHSAFGYQGQKCSACSRVIVIGDKTAFVERLKQATASLTIGPADDPASAIGPVIDDEAKQRILARIAEAKNSATLAYAGSIPLSVDDAGSYVAPHIFTDVDPSSSLAQDEIFGPVLAIISARDLDEALRIANGTRFALTGGFYSRSPSAILRVTREFRVGNLYINRKITGALVDVQPFGGFKLSGIGSKAGGPDYLLQFLVPRCVTENTLRHGFTPDL